MLGPMVTVLGWTMLTSPEPGVDPWPTCVASEAGAPESTHSVDTAGAGRAAGRASHAFVDVDIASRPLEPAHETK